MKNIDEILSKIEIRDFNHPIFELGSWFSIWSEDIGWGITLCETWPYAPDGEVPLIFVDMGRCQIMIESPKLYKYLYKRKYGEEIE